MRAYLFISGTFEMTSSCLRVREARRWGTRDGESVATTPPAMGFVGRRGVLLATVSGCVLAVGLACAPEPPDQDDGQSPDAAAPATGAPGEPASLTSSASLAGMHVPGERSSEDPAPVLFAAPNAAGPLTASPAPASPADPHQDDDDPLAPSVLVLSLDTLRADRLGSYGYEPRRTASASPNLDALARRSVVFESARAAASQTAPSHASLFTSTSLGVHGVINVHGPSPRVHKLPPGVVTLAERAQASGRATAAFVSGGNLSGRMDLDRGFDHWDETFEDVRGRTQAAVKWMFAPGRGRFFAVLHTYQVHAPYLPPRELAAEFIDPAYQGPLRARLDDFLALPEKAAWQAAVGPAYWEGMLEYTDDDVAFLSDLYDAEIRYLDAVLRDLIEVVLRSELSRDLVLVILSDHGEEFRDHGKFQHDQLYEEHLRVPLVIKLPGALERDGWHGRVDVPVSLLDVAPTLAELMGLPEEPRLWQGRSLVPLLRPDRDEVRARFADRPVFSELIVDPGPQFHSAVSWNGWKLLRVHYANRDLTVERLYDLGADPLEARNLIDSEDRAAVRALQALRRLLEERQATNLELARIVGEGGTEEMDAEMEARMRALGYVGGDGH